MPLDLTARADAAAGDALERVVRGHHRRRLKRLGWPRVLGEDSGAGAPFADPDPPPRAGNELEVLVDGANALPVIADAIASARDHVHLTGWHLAPHFELVRGEERVVLGQLLAETAERVDVRVLVWAGAPVPLFHPTRSEVDEAVRTLTHRTRIQCRTDPREHPVHCHHEKTVVIDGEVAFVGGIDLTDQAGDRYDESAHPARRKRGWHDVGTRLRGPAVHDVGAHFAMRWHEVTGERLDPPPVPGEAGGSTVQVVRTVAEDMYDAVPRGDFRLFQSYLRTMHAAQHLISIENQFLWSPEIVEVLAGKLRNPPHDDFRIVVLLPARADNGQDDTRGQLGVLCDADRDGGGGRFLALTIRSLSGTRDDPLYVHAKVATVDDRHLIVGSANLNAHSLLNDTEMNVVTDDATLARETRIRLWSEHLGVAPETLAQEAPAITVDARLRPTAAEQLARRAAGSAPTHRLLELPGVSRRTKRLLGPLQGLLADG